MFSIYTGAWTFDEAAHLLRRTIFGPTKARIQQAVDDGLDATIATLFSSPSPPDPPIYFDFENDPLAANGETWVDAPFDEDIDDLPSARAKSLSAWWYKQMNQNDQSITEKLTLFWHNHFVVSDSDNANLDWRYLNKLRNFALGNFRELTKEITIDRSMLFYLNGNSNFKDEPNENYARELLELFTIGKGPLAGVGDYTNFTEQDIAAMARALTGWSAETEDDPNAIFVEEEHDPTPKILSHRFDNTTIQNDGEEEYKTVIDIIFGKEEVARHICRRLYIWFIHYHITDTIEAEIIVPMAQILLDNDYEIQPALEALLKSEHFFDPGERGCMIKNTFDFFYSSFNTLHVAPPVDILEEYQMWNEWDREFKNLDMSVFNVPSVAGWKAYHQAPVFYRDWVNSASAVIRKRLMPKFNYVIQNVSPDTKGYDWINFISLLDNPLEVNEMIDEICLLIYPRPMIDEQKAFFKDALIPGLPDFEWNVEYADYLSDPTDDVKREALENKLYDMFMVMMQVPEFQMS
ncbi:MAG: DUF1800 family protein [Saprospiraceae bacterium]